jgi:hypothetical protein
MLQIISDNVINCPASLTRNQYFESKDRYIGGGMDCRLTLDGNLLSDNYKIRPYHDKEYFETDFKGDTGQEFDPTEFESEERVDKPIFNVNRYLKEITIYKNKLSVGWDGSIINDVLGEGSYDTSEAKTLDEFIETVIYLLQDYTDVKITIK